MSKKISGLFAVLAFLGLTLFLINCGSSSSRPAGVLYVLSQGESNVESYAIDLGGGGLSLINKTSPTETTPSTILLDVSGNVAHVLNTGSNSITSYTIGSDGTLSAPTSTGLTVQHSVAMALNADGTFLFVVSQGAIPLPPGGAPCPHPEPNSECPAVTVFAAQSGSTTLTQVGNPVALNQVPTSVSSINAAGKILLYISNDVDLTNVNNDNTVAAYQVDAASGAVTAQTNAPYATGSIPTAVRALATNPTGGSGGVFVYVANGGSGSGSDSISIFRVCTAVSASCTSTDVTDSNNTLIPVGTPVSVGLNPVAMTVDPTINFLYVVNHDSSTVSAFRINPTTGALTPLSPSSVSTGSDPVGITMHSSGKFLYVSNSGSSNVSGFNADTTSGALSNATNVTSSAQPAGLVAR